MSTTPIIGAKVDRHAEIVADANHLKAGSDYSVKAVRRAERDALRELSEDHDSVAGVEEVDLPSVRLEEGDYGSSDDEDE